MSPRPADLSAAKHAAALAGERARRQETENAELKAELAEFRRTLMLLREKVEQTIILAKEPIAEESS